MSTYGLETEYLEFKESTAQLNRALESLTAMLNKHGSGEVLFGVNDKGEPIGQDIGQKTLNDISMAIAHGIKPTITPTIEIKKHDNCEVISVKVKGSNKPYGANGLYFIRSGSQNRRLDPGELRELFFSSSPESISIMKSLNQTPTFKQLKQLFIINDLTVNDGTFETNCGLKNDKGEYNELSYILSDNNDVSIKVVGFSSLDKSEMLYRNEYGYHCLILAMQRAMDYVIALNETRVELDGSLQRKETPLFNEKCFREAWVNACLHNQWSSLVPPAIYIFPDRMEIISMGGLPNNLSKEEFFSGVSRPVNRSLMRIMGQLGLIEQTGHGVPEIIKKYSREAFDIAENHITVTLRFPFLMKQKPGLYDGLSESEKNVLMAISTHPSATASDLAKLSGLKISRTNAIIRDLKNLGKIKREGSNKDGYYTVIGI